MNRLHTDATNLHLGVMTSEIPLASSRKVKQYSCQSIVSQHNEDFSTSIAPSPSKTPPPEKMVYREQTHTGAEAATSHLQHVLRLPILLKLSCLSTCAQAPNSLEVLVLSNVYILHYIPNLITMFGTQRIRGQPLARGLSLAGRGKRGAGRWTRPHNPCPCSLPSPQPTL
jgi:hypothetical protein